jgi:hypothetical protein
MLLALASARGLTTADAAAIHGNRGDRPLSAPCISGPIKIYAHGTIAAGRDDQSTARWELRTDNSCTPKGPILIACQEARLRESLVDHDAQ